TTCSNAEAGRFVPRAVLQAGTCGRGDAAAAQAFRSRCENRVRRYSAGVACPVACWTRSAQVAELASKYFRKICTNTVFWNGIAASQRIIYILIAPGSTTAGDWIGAKRNHQEWYLGPDSAC